MNKQELTQKIEQVIQSIEKGTLLHLEWYKFIGYGIFVLLLLLNSFLTPIYLIINKTDLNIFLMSLENRILFSFLYLFFYAVLFFLTTQIVKLFVRRTEIQKSSTHVKGIYSLYKPIILTIIALIIASYILTIIPTSSVSFLYIINPLILILVSYIIFIIGRLSTKSIYLLSLINICIGLTLVVILPLIHHFFGGITKIIIISIGQKISNIILAVSLILTGIFYKNYINNKK